jgi:hypothetical protein
MKRHRTAQQPIRPLLAASAAGHQSGHPAETAAGTGHGYYAGTSPVILLTYAHSGAQQVQDILAAGTGLACTSGTGIIPQCATAADAWQQVESRDGLPMSHLAASTVRRLVTAQVTMILASTGKYRWCELCIAAPPALQPFLQVFPLTAVVCVHRRCADVITATVDASPWGLRSPALLPYLLSYPGNNVAAIAAYWANQTNELLAFEKTNPAGTRRILLEDITADSAATLTTLTTLQDWLKLSRTALPALPQQPCPPQPESHPPPASIPAEMIPPVLRQRINRLHTELGYPPIEET